MSVKELLAYLTTAILLILAIIFALASAYEPLRLITSAFLFIAAFAILIYIRRQKPTTIIQKLEIPGQIKAQPITCPNCSASLNINQAKIIDGVPSITCKYCGHTFEITEEPKW